MTRTLKAMGLALLAALALSAVAAQGASAEVKHSFSREEPAWITGEADPTSPAQAFSAGGAVVVTCQELHLDGRAKEVSEDTLTLLPQYSNCSATGGLAATVENKGKTKPGMTEGGCSYIFGSDTTTNAATPMVEDAPVSIECEAGAKIVVEVYGVTPAEHLKKPTEAPLCTLDFGELSGVNKVNQSLHGVKYTNVQTSGKKEEVTAEAKVHGIHYVATGELCFLANLENGKTYTNGKYEGTVTGKVFKNEGTTEQVEATMMTP